MVALSHYLGNTMTFQVSISLCGRLPIRNRVLLKAHVSRILKERDDANKKLHRIDVALKDIKSANLETSSKLSRLEEKFRKITSNKDSAHSSEMAGSPNVGTYAEQAARNNKSDTNKREQAKINHARRDVTLVTFLKEGEDLSEVLS